MNYYRGFRFCPSCNKHVVNSSSSYEFTFVRWRNVNSSGVGMKENSVDEGLPFSQSPVTSLNPLLLSGANLCGLIETAGDEVGAVFLCCPCGQGYACSTDEWCHKVPVQCCSKQSLHLKADYLTNDWKEKEVGCDEAVWQK